MTAKEDKRCVLCGEYISKHENKQVRICFEQLTKRVVNAKKGPIEASCKFCNQDIYDHSRELLQDHLRKLSDPSSNIEQNPLWQILHTPEKFGLK